MTKKAFFFDRDGIINKRKIGGYITTKEHFIFEVDFFNIFQKIVELGFITIVITNQQGVGKGLMSEADLNEIHVMMQETIKAKTGFQFDGIYYCGDLEDSGSQRRKPFPGMIEEAVKDFYIDVSHSWMIGDSPSDVQAGKSAGCKTILIGDYARDFPNADLVYTTLKEFLVSLPLILNK